MDNKDRIKSLQKHAEKVKAQALNPDPKKYHGNKLKSYQAWVNLEIKRTLSKIEYLKGGK